MKNKELLDKWDNMKPHERNDLIFYDVLDRMPLNTTPNEFGGFGTIPRYSEDISAAWEVVEKVKEKNLYLSVHVLKDNKYFGVFCSDIFENDIEVEADSMPELICKAALLAVLGEE